MLRVGCLLSASRHAGHLVLIPQGLVEDVWGFELCNSEGC